MDGLDDLLSNFDFGAADPFAKETANEWFMVRMTEGKHPHIHAIRWNCIRHLEFRAMLKKANLHITKETMENGVLNKREATDREYLSQVVRDHVTSSHHASIQFAEHDNRGKFDLAKAIDAILDYHTLADVQEIAKKNIKGD